MMRIALLLVAALCLKAAEPVDSIWSAKYVVTMDAERRVIDDGDRKSVV